MANVFSTGIGLIGFIRSTLFYVVYILSLMMFGVLSLFLIMLPRRLAAPAILCWNRLVLFSLRIICGVRVTVRGDFKKVPTPCVLIANHQSAWETIFLQLHVYPLTTVLKKELLQIPFFGWGLRILNPIAINRSNPVQALKHIRKTGVERLQQGHSVLIFPEGTRQPVEQLGDFTRSGADIAKAAGVPIVNIAHNGGQCWLNKQYLKLPGEITVMISEPVNSDGNTKTIIQQSQDWIAQQLSTLKDPH